jgi:hypothetical protein
MPEGEREREGEGERERGREGERERGNKSSNGSWQQGPIDASKDGSTKLPTRM